MDVMDVLGHQQDFTVRQTVGNKADGPLATVGLEPVELLRLLVNRDSRQLLDGPGHVLALSIEQAVGQARLDILHSVTADFPELQLGVLSAAVGHLAIEPGVDFGTFAQTDNA